MTNPDRLASWRRLGKLAQKPFDLTAPDAVSPARVASYICHGAGLDLLYSCQRVDEEVLDALQCLADETGAVEQFLSMEKGAVCNRIEGYDSENRMVLHTACRDFFQDCPRHAAASDAARRELDKLRAFLNDLDRGRIGNAQGQSFTDLVQIGIGGSDLGPRAVALALTAFFRKDRRLSFIANVDPDDQAAVLSSLDLSRTLVNVVSKSGGTLETLTNETLAREAFLRQGLDPSRHFVAVTAAGSPMDNQEKYLRSFSMFDYVGGRYSTTSAVGAVALGFALGFDALDAFLRGANAMDRMAEEPRLRKNPALLLAMLGIWNRNFLGSDTLAVLPYSQALSRFAAHLQQCDMESNGKSVNRQGKTTAWQTGPIVWGEPGTNGQHAFFQLLHQGTSVVPAEFIGFRQSQRGCDMLVAGSSSQDKLLANLLAQTLALACGQKNDNPNRRFDGNRPSTLIMANRLDPSSMGALLALYEAKIVLQGFVWNINSFDQEGVQLGKKLASAFLAALAARRKGADEVLPLVRAMLDASLPVD